MSTDEIIEFGRRWAEAEKRGDVDALADMAVDDFRLVGPLGFVLDRTQWLDRYRSGRLVTEQLSLTEVDVRFYGATAVAIGIHDQRATFGDQRADGRFRSTHILLDGPTGWRLVGIQLSRLAPPPGVLRQD